MFNNQISNLISNLPERNTIKPIELDLVLEGGGFNGSYEVGVMYFLKELINKKYIVINRISGASIGSIVGLCYILDKLDLFVEKYKSIRKYWRENIDLKVIKNIIVNICDSITDEQFNIIKKNKLYITYYSLKEKKQITKNNYDNIDDLKDGIIRSCYLPYILDDDIGYKCEEQYFIDGGHPYIFHNREKSLSNKILYISINQLKNIPYMISTKNENNIYGRILRGILDCYDFFLNYLNGNYKESELCSFIDEWSSFRYITLYIKQILIIFVVYILYYIHCIIEIVNPYIENIQLYRELYPIFSNLYKNIVLFMCF
jgi:hypothetical protein